MTVALWILVTLLTLDAAGIAIFLACRFLSSSGNASIVEVGPFVVALGALIALVAFLINLKRARSEDLLDAAIALLEKGYQALEAEAGSKTPSQRRLAWLTSARLLATAESLGDKITESSHRRIYGDTKEYWRSRFYELIFPSPPAGLPATFYADKPEHMIEYTNDDREPLSERSLAYLYRFIRWPEDTADPIGDVPDFTDGEIEKMQAFGPRDLGRLLAQVRRLNSGPAK